MKHAILLFAGLAFLTFKNQAQTVTDIDGNVYNTLTIGTQVWMKENLKVTHYLDGTTIPNITSNATWISLNTGGRCYYDNDSSTYAPIYGALYNWYAATEANNICPTGWHVPSDGEWNIMEKYLDNTIDTTIIGWAGTDIGNKLKEVGTTHWNSLNTGATNSSGFTALPGGWRYYNNGTFYAICDQGDWWTGTACSAGNQVWERTLDPSKSQINRGSYEKASGFSVRCIMDILATQINENSIDKQIQIYPNPAIDKIIIDCGDRKDLKMQVYNIIGDCVLQCDLTSGSNGIDISSLTSGIYLIRLSEEEERYQQKLIKN